MSVADRTVREFERHRDPVVHPSPESNNNNNNLPEECPPKRAFFRRRLPSEFLDDLPESSVDPQPGEEELELILGGVGGGGGGAVGDLGLSPLLLLTDRGASPSSGRYITLVGSPAKKQRPPPPPVRSRSVDYSRFRVTDSKSYAERANLDKIPERTPKQDRSLLCQECSSGTLFGIYHTPTSRRKTLDLQPKTSIVNENHWERTPLPAQSSFTSTSNSAKVSQTYNGPDTSSYQTKTFHCTPELRYKPVYFGDPRLRRFSCGYSDRRTSREITVSGLQDFCRTMLAVKTPNEKFKEEQIINAKNEENNRIQSSETISEKEENDHNLNDSHPQKTSKQGTPLRSPKLVKEVLKRMSSHPSGRDPQVREAFSDEDDADFVVDHEAMRVIDAFNKSLADISTIDRIKRSVQHTGPLLQNVDSTNGRDHGLQSDNLVEEVLLSERKYAKTHGLGCLYFSEKFKGRDEIEESKRFMSLSSDQKSKRSSTVGESPAPPKPPRNYDSLPRGFKTPSQDDSHHDMLYSGIHPLSNSNSGSQCSASPQQNYFVVVAIDFGTTYSGYAFCFTQDSDNIFMMRNWECSQSGVVNQKTPTTLLLDPEGRFHSFGYAARECYHDLEQQEAKRWLYFEKFKMALHKTENLSRDTIIYAANGKGVPAMTVFAHALRFFKEHALQELSDQSATPILCEDVRWVVSVPAIWRQPAKQFMRNASYEAGIASPENPEQLLIALEPEVASIFCRRLRMHQLVPTAFNAQRLSVPNIKEPAEGSLELAVKESAGMRYMVVDCGGGTVDITVHEIIDENGTIKELHKATGGPYGSVGIDLEFEKLLDDIFGVDFMDQFKTKRPAIYIDLMVSFEARKRNASPFKITPINIALPFAFIDYYKKTKNSTVMAAVKKYNSKEIMWSHGMLRLEPSAMMNLFQPTLNAIRGHISNVLENCESGGISYLFLVGGFAESAILQKSIRDAFSDKLKVIIPQGVSLAILKGAVLFGVDPTVVSSRRSRLTYGVGVLNRFIHGVHPPEKLVVKDGVEWCADVFDKFVLADQSVCVGDTVIRRYTPARSGQACSVIHIYCSERDDDAFITDPGVKRCGTLVLDLSEDKLPEEDKEKQQPGKREIQTVMIFGDTELKVSALDVLTGRCVKAEIDFLNA